MTETTRDDGIWYRENILGREVEIPQVKKVVTRYGDDANNRGPFKLVATKATISTWNSDIPINRPGGLLEVSDGKEVALTLVDKANERFVEHRIVERNIMGLGVWSQVVGKKGRTNVISSVPVDEAIETVLEALNVPHGTIDPTPTAILDWFWLDRSQDAEQVLLGLMDIAGLDARLDDYSGAITFTNPLDNPTRLRIHGGEDYVPDGVTDAADRGSEAGVSFQGGVQRRANSTWYIQPFTEFEYNGQTYVIECFDSVNPSRNVYRIRALISSTTTNDPITAMTFANAMLYLNLRIDDFESMSGTTTRTGLLFARGTDGRDRWSFDEQRVEGGQQKAYFYLTISGLEADSATNVYFTIGATDATPAVITAPGESPRLRFTEYQRHDEDSRYFNTVRVDTRTLIEQSEDVIWTAPENITVAENATILIQINASEGTAVRTIRSMVEGFDYTIVSGRLNGIRTLGSGSSFDLQVAAGAGGVVLSGVQIRGTLLVPGVDTAYTDFDQDAVRRDGEIAWESAGIVPRHVNRDYLETWAEATLERGLERRWTAQIHFREGALSHRENWETLVRLRPGRLVAIEHSGGSWEGIVRQVERTSGSDVDHIDKFKVTCELTGLTQARDDAIRVGLTTYGDTEKVLA